MKEKQFINIIRFTPAVFVVVVSLLVIVFLYIENKRLFLQQKIEVEQKYYFENSQIIKNEVNRAYSYIKYLQKNTEEELRKSIKEKIYEAHSIASNIYEKYKDTKNKDEIFTLIKIALENIRFNEGRGYFYIDDINGKKLLLPLDRENEGKSFLDYEDANGYKFVRTIVKTIKDKSERFDEYYWDNPVTRVPSRKIAFYKYFEPFDVVIGTGEYFEEYQAMVQKKALEYINVIKFDKNGYVFIMNNKGACLSNPNKNLINKNENLMSAIISSEGKTVSQFVNGIGNVEKGFYKYQEAFSESNIGYKANKISYIKALTEWNWIIGSEFYEDDVNIEIMGIKKKLDNESSTYIQNIIIITVFLTIILLLISRNISKFIEKKFSEYTENLAINQSILHQQSKMATMGEMIGNIAHQWKQPLSIITATATGMSIQKEIGQLKDNDFFEGTKKINNAAQYLSQTIDNFRNFFNPNKEQESFKIKDTLEKTLDLISVQFNSKNILIIQNIEDIEMINYENSLIQVLINILNNARDELISKKYPKYIFIDVTRNKENKVEIIIKDNAGGIKEENIDKIFNSYFTTKEKSSGTGIGLHMTKNIITKQLNGQIEASNVDFEYENEKYTGAEFKIILNS